MEFQFIICWNTANQLGKALFGLRCLQADRFRTAVNTFGDSVGAAVVEGTLPAEGATTGPKTQPQPLTT